MHRITLPDGTTRKSNTLRYTLAVAYFLMGTAGVFLQWSPIFREAYSWRIEVMAWFLIVGGFTSFLGTVTYRWVGEFCGVPLLTSAFAVFGVVTLRENWAGSWMLALANGFLLWAVSALLISRWRVSLAWYRFVAALGKEGRDV